MRKRAYAGIARFMARSKWGRRFLLLVRRYPAGFEWASVAFEALLMYLVISSFVVRAYAIPSASMRPTLKEGDRIFVNKFIYRFRCPEYGDIVVFRTPESIYDPEKPEFVKRVVGLPNDEVEIRRAPGRLWGHLYINDRPPPEGNKLREIIYYTRVGTMGRPFPRTPVPDDEIYVFGDNSQNSLDSREWGGVPLENLRGKAFFRFWPPGRVGPLE
jgi:signal peptidase I